MSAKVPVTDFSPTQGRHALPGRTGPPVHTPPQTEHRPEHSDLGVQFQKLEVEIKKEGELAKVVEKAAAEGVWN